MKTNKVMNALIENGLSTKGKVVPQHRHRQQMGQGEMQEEHVCEYSDDWNERP